MAEVGEGGEILMKKSKLKYLFSLLFNEAFNTKKKNPFLAVFEKETDLESILLKSKIAHAVETQCYDGLLS